MTKVNKQWRLKRRPQGELEAQDFEWTEAPVAQLRDNEVLVRHLYLSLDPTNRIWANEKDSYMPAVKIGDVMRGGGIGIVEESRHEKVKSGDFVQGVLGWQSYCVADGNTLAHLHRAEGVPLTAYHGLFGPIGMTAYFGLMDIGQPKAGETLVVSAAAGAVGSLVGQIGRREGCRVVGIAGSDDKCGWLTESLGFDAAINYQAEKVADALREHCPNGIDIYFDNVGGEILDAALGLINVGARIPLCGMISTYNDREPRPGPRNMANILVQRARLQGFIVIDYFSRAKEAYDYLMAAYRADEIDYRVDVVEGLENAPESLNLLFTGGNQGKLIVKVDADWHENGNSRNA